MRSQVSPCVLFPPRPSIPRPAHPIRTRPHPLHPSAPLAPVRVPCTCPHPLHLSASPHISWAICPFFSRRPPSPLAAASQTPRPASRAFLFAPAPRTSRPPLAPRPRSSPASPRIRALPSRPPHPIRTHPHPSAPVRTPRTLSAPPPAYLLGYMPIFLPPSPFPPRRSLPNPAPRFARLPICTRSPHIPSAPRAPSAFLSGLAAHPRPSIPPPSPHPHPSAPIRTRPHPSHPVRTPAYLLGYIPSRIRRSPSSSSLYVYRRS